MAKRTDDPQEYPVATSAPFPPPLAPPPPPTDAVIEGWWQETFCNIGLDTQLYNRFRAAANRLKALLAAAR